MKRFLMNFAILLACALPTVSIAGEYKVFCPNGATIMLAPSIGPANEPLVNIEPSLVGATCNNTEKTTYVIQGLDAIPPLPSKDEAMKVMQQAKAMFGQPRTAQIGAPRR